MPKISIRGGQQRGVGVIPNSPRCPSGRVLPAQSSSLRSSISCWSPPTGRHTLPGPRNAVLVVYINIWVYFFQPMYGEKLFFWYIYPRFIIYEKISWHFRFWLSLHARWCQVPPPLRVQPPPVSTPMMIFMLLVVFLRCMAIPHPCLTPNC